MAKALRSFHARLKRWYAAHGRKDLPWRRTRDPYAIYVSEIMLQQTQVKTVLERYYTPFLTRFPTLKSLANAHEKDVLKAWQGLGYYNRAIHLHRAAKACKSDLPATIEGLLALPGIGKNTAHAVAAFAYRQPVAVMEANVKRVLSRIFALSAPTEKELWAKADALLNRAESFDYNQAMMDIGALICTRRNPKCDSCPANTICQGKNSPKSYPALKKKKAAPVRKKIIVVLQNAQGKYHATARKSAFLRGLYAFEEDSLPRRGRVRVGANLRGLGNSRPPSSLRSFGASVDRPNLPPAGGGVTFLGRIRQSYSHFTLEAEVYVQKSDRPRDGHWYTLRELKTLPMSMAEQKILKLL